MSNRYTTEDLQGEFFYNKIIEEMNDDVVELQKMVHEFFNDKVSVNKFQATKPVVEYCPVEQTEKEFAFPLAKDIYKIFSFCKGNYNSIEDVKESIQNIKRLLKLGSNYVSINSDTKLMSTRLGFLMVLARKRFKLCRGEDLSAYDLAILLGISNQGVVNYITRGKLDAKKEGPAYKIDNKVAWNVLKTKKEEVSDFY